MCSGRKIGVAPEYKNSIWASIHKEIFSPYLTETQMKSHMHGSTKKINFTCPVCGVHKQTSPNHFLHHGLSCGCKEGRNYPNKYMYSLLNQLKINFIKEYKPEWSHNKRYDIFIPRYNMIIENHGGQHYKECFTFTHQTLEYQKENDKYKRELALQNNITSYIEIDCRESTTQWIKNSVLKSELPTLVGFTEADINWDKCNKDASHSILEEVAHFWDDGLSVAQIANKIEKSRSTTLNYLSKSSEIKLCNYSKEESRRRCAKNHSGIASPVARKVYCIELKQYFSTIREAAEATKLCANQISNCCRGKRKSTGGFHWMYYNDWITQHIGDDKNEKV